LTGVFAAQPAGFFLAFLIGLLLLRRTLRKLDAGEANAQTVPAFVIEPNK